MRIIRHLTPSGPAYAALQSDGSAREIAGDIYGDFRVTDRAVKPGKLLAPVVPVYLPCIGLNYKRHAAESNSAPPPHPVLFVKNPASAQNPGDPIELPVKLPSTSVDYECELAVVIGKRCKNATRANALDFVLGYTCANDVSPATGSATAAVASGAAARPSILSLRSAPCSSPRTKSPIPTSSASAPFSTAKRCRTGTPTT